ncbi:hypothetical protein BFJ69_g5538 [Fusarium oxysporum]|uniref:Uncharacterized protein n=1 Tax=Fusarium oxysporum TaxID=5507 RepID=A0A420NE03_FUSOX|nr:hypothetical protein BFJ69_g5538 [Fusarium oxysporum]
MELLALATSAATMPTYCDPDYDVDDCAEDLLSITTAEDKST